MGQMTVKLSEVRAQAATRSLFAPTSLARAVARLGFVQADPIAAPARAQDLILRHRVRNYRAGDLERRYPDLDVDEDYLHVYGYMPRSVSALLHPRAGEWRVDREYPKLAERVLKFVREAGESDHRQLEKHLGRLSTTGDWGGQANATTRILDMLHYRGHVRVARRSGNARRFAAASPPESTAPPEERLRQLVMVLARLYAPTTEATLRELVARLRYSAPSLDGRRTAVRDLLKSGELEQADVAGMTYIWPGGEWQRHEAPREVRFLAPFDPIVYDRRRFEHLWGWPYRFEAYTPVAKRRWGYYAMPLLWGDRIIGWANASLDEGGLRVEVGFVNRRPAGRDFKIALEAEYERLQACLSRGRGHGVT